jgi:hypothetical protein
MENIKYQTVDVKQAAGTVKGKYTESVELDSNFDFCDGVQAIDILNGGITFYSIGLEDKNNTYQNVTHKSDWNSSTSTPINHRYKSIFIPVVRGDKVDIRTQVESDLVSELHYQLIFRLRKNPAKK